MPGHRALHRTAALSLALQAAALTSPVLAAEAPPLPRYVHDHWTYRDGLPHNVVETVHPDRAGYLWLGTQEGLVRFDGVRFQVFDRAGTPGLPSDEIFALEEDADGDLWVGTLGGLARRHGERIEAVPLGDGPQPGVHALLAVGQDLWVGTTAGLFRLRGGELRRFGTDDGLPDERVAAVAAARGGGVWTAGRRGLARSRGDRFEPAPADGLPGEVVSSVLEGPDGALLAGLPQGLFRRPAGGGAFARVAGIGEREVRSLFLDRAGAVWAALSSGIARLRGDLVELDESGATMVTEVAEDQEGTIWFGTSTYGLHRLRPGSLFTIARPRGLSSQVVWAVARDQDGAVLAAGDGGLDRIVGEVPRPVDLGIDRREALGGLLVDAGGALWVGTDSHGLLRRGPEGDRWFGAADGLRTAVRVVYQDPRGALLVGARDGVYRVDGERFSRLTTTSGLVNAVAAAPDGALWVGTTSGLVRYAEGRATPVPLADDPTPADVTALHFDADGGAWVGTAGAGLWLLRGGRAFAFTRRQGLLEDVVFAIVDDQLGGLWLSGNHGIRRVARAELEAVASGKAAAVGATMLGHADGMLEVECSGGVQPAALRTPDGRLWFPTIDGVVVVEPAAIRTNPVAPRVVFEALVVDGRRRPITPSLRLAPGTRHVEIQYTAPSLSSGDRVRFRHRLVGSEEAFVDAGSQRVVHFAGLRPGAYRFELRAANESSLWSEPAALDFTIEPRLWQRTSVRALGALLALAAVLAGVRLRTRRLEQQKVALELRVQEELSRVKVLQGMLPICAWCRKIRDDAGYWERIEVYVSERSEATFTHGICPDCERKFDAEEARAGRPGQR